MNKPNTNGDGKKELARFCIPGERKTRNPTLNEQWATAIQDDVYVFADDLAIKETGSHGIYPKLITFVKYASKYQIHISWNRIKVINESECEIQSIKKKLTGEYRGIEFGTSGPLLGQEINLQA